jgi:hypothetical protein
MSYPYVSMLRLISSSYKLSYTSIIAVATYISIPDGIFSNPHGKINNIRDRLLFMMTVADFH